MNAPAPEPVVDAARRLKVAAREKARADRVLGAAGRDAEIVAAADAYNDAVDDLVRAHAEYRHARSVATAANVVEMPR